MPNVTYTEDGMTITSATFNLSIVLQLKEGGGQNDLQLKLRGGVVNNSAPTELIKTVKLVKDSL